MKRNKMDFSAEEIIILAGLLGYHRILVIDDGVFYEFADNNSDRISNVVESFEKNNIIYYDFGGNLFVSADIKTIIDTICNPKYVMVCDGTFENGKRQIVYLAVCENIVLFREKQKNSYEFEPYDIKDIKRCINKYVHWDGDADLSQETKQDDEMFHEVIPKEDANRLRESLVSFQEKEAVDYLKQKLSKEDAMRPIMDFLSGRCKYIRVQLLSKVEDAYQNIYDVLIADNGNQKMKVALDRDKVFHFLYAETIDICGELMAKIMI